MFKAQAREIQTKAAITPKGAAAVLLDGTQIIAWNLEEGNDSLPLGSVASSRYTLTLVNAKGEWLPGGSLRGDHSLIGATVSIEIGVKGHPYEPVGVFVVEKTTYNEGDMGIILIGSDALLYGLSQEFNDTQTYPRTIQEIFEHITSGIALDPDYSTLACNQSVSITHKPKWGKGLTVREALSHVLAAGGSFFRVGRNGMYQVVPAYSPTPTHVLDTSMYMMLTDDEMAFSFNRLKVDFGEKESISSALDDGIEEKASNTLTLSGNPLLVKYTNISFSKTTDTTVNPDKIYYVLDTGLYKPVSNPADYALSIYYERRATGANTTTAQAVADGLKAFFSGMTLKGMNIRWRGDPSLKVGDRITLVDTRGKTHETSIHQQTLSFVQGFSATIICALDDEDVMGTWVPDSIPGIEVSGQAWESVPDGSITTQKLAAEVKLLAYPVGAIYLSLVNTSPAILFGGTWEALGGRFLLGADGTYTAGSAGGSDKHKHNLGSGYGLMGIAGTGDLQYKYKTTPSWQSNWKLNGTASATSTAAREDGMELGGTTDDATTLPPYLAVYMWKRTA